MCSACNGSTWRSVCEIPNTSCCPWRVHKSLQYLLSTTTKYHYHWPVILLDEKHYKMKQVFNFSQKKKHIPTNTIQKPTQLSNPPNNPHPQRSISPTCPWSALSSARAASTSERCRRTSASAAALASLNFAATWAFATCRWSLKSIHKKHVFFMFMLIYDYSYVIIRYVCLEYSYAFFRHGLSCMMTK